MTDTRDAFEAWFTGPIGTNFLNKKDGYYTLISAQTSWIAWQAATLAAQDKRKPLTDEQIIDWAVQWPAETNDWASHFDFARAIEAAHGIKQ